MGRLGVVVGILHYAGLYVQLNAALISGHNNVDNHVSGNALFTEVPHDITTQSGEDVEMACSFRGAGSPSHALEIQWWYIKDRQKESSQITNNVVPEEERSNRATKISVVKVAGSNISHKLRLSSVRTSDEGTYECRVIDYSSTVVKDHRVRAYLHVEPKRGHELDVISLQEHQEHQSIPQRDTGVQKLKRRSSESITDCNDSCVL
ncbi:V-set and transmembrane domain-containing protein 2-like protein [Cynoglossus semilaevis]|uniref:V-set and transmembrane domain containing 2 like n=1 Tax=Cynoglossus semilaevis TaxID=244447 RepID=A0A3P8V540_CYNSE|nr:V-set and transmembrane domain-containing protein 2-like protein [Cynoglossus semilaevis]